MPSPWCPAAYALFGSPQNGITKRAFKKHMQKLGFVLTDQELQALFNRYDSDGSGSITFAELVAHVMPKVGLAAVHACRATFTLLTHACYLQDYTRPTWSIKRDMEDERKAAKRSGKFEPVVRKWPKSLGNNRMSMREVEEAIQRKITERTKRASDQYREGVCVCVRAC